ncbi:MAG TPA: redoxin domain-containing protein [Planctomycetota bacterium]|nr:redoxin domain-containing protein [Planctomycetota bacterium]
MLRHWPVLLVSFACAVLADDDAPQASDKKADGVLAGHSVHGEAFNEGPRQQAYLMEGMPNIVFPVSTKNELTQKFFNQGVAQLHGFWYFEAERSFRQAAAHDPKCPMTYWGMAMANIKNAKRAGEFIKKAQDLKPADKREQLWINAYADYFQKKKDDKEKRKDLIKALENIEHEFPDDIEAKAFLVFQAWDNSQKGIPISSTLAFNALITEVLAVNPMHPIHHYRIHIWDSDGKAERALKSAALCGQCSPGIAHMWHMPGHTYSKLNRFADATWQQEASARTDHAHMMRDRVLPDQIHNYAHNNDWLVQNLSHIGRVQDAIELARNMVELPRVPKFKAKANADGSHDYDSGGSSYAMGRNRLYEVLTRWELWEELLEMADSAYLEKGDSTEEKARHFTATGVAYFSRGNKSKGKEQLASLEQLLTETRAEQQKAGDDASAKAKTEKKPEDQIKKAKEDAVKAAETKIKNLEKNITELKAYQALAEKDRDGLKKALEKLKDISQSRLSQLWFEAGDKDKAEKLAKEACEKGAGQIYAIANYVDILQRCGKRVEAQQQFEKLRQMSAYADLEMPIFKRVSAVAKDVKLPSDWRVPAKTSEDTGNRPDLARLGPFRWQPSPALEWTLPDTEGKSVSLRKYRGKPVVLMFYLGRTCAHCMEQLNLFAPMVKDFADAGISLVAIGTDEIAELSKTRVKGKESEPFPFTLLSDPRLTAFKPYRVYDDFEKMPLHATFLIDAQGLVRWQDISFDPFREPKFLLAEAKRLLSLPKPDKRVSKSERPEPYLP